MYPTCVDLTFHNLMTWPVRACLNMTIPVLQSDCLWRTSCMDQIQPSVTAQVSSNKTIEPLYCLGDLPPAGTTNSETTRFYCVYHTRLVTGAESFRIVEMSRDKRQTLLTETSRRKAALLTDKLQLHVGYYQRTEIFID